MLKRLLLLSITLFTAAEIKAQNDTISYVFDFENQSLGNLNGQDNWLTTSYNVTDDWKVIDTLSSHPGKLILFNRSGPSVGCDASRLLDTATVGFEFDTANAMYVLEFDVKRNYWGLSIGLAADLNNDGKTLKADVAEKAFIFTTGSLNGENVYLPNSSTLSLQNTLGNGWETVQLIIRPFNGFVGTFTAGHKPAGSQTYTNMIFNSPLYVDTAGNAKYNFTLWNVLFLHAEGAGSYFDNIRLSKISNLTTSLNENSANEIAAYYYDYQLFLDKQTAGNEPFEIHIYDAAGRDVMNKKQHNAETVSLAGLTKGWYCAMIRKGNDVKKLPFYAQ